MAKFRAAPQGTLPVHMFKCDAVGTCHRSTWTTEVSRVGAGFEIVTREKAADHVRATGHQVDFVQGTIETLASMRVETP
jgi:hypothetical protein